MVLTWSWGAHVVTADASEEELRQELRQLDERIRELEASRHEQSDQDGRPLHALSKTSLGGDVTMIGQMTPSVAPGEQAEGTLSLDLFLEHQLKATGLVLLQLDMAQGPGFQVFPVFVAPNGNPTGSNNDIETFDEPTTINVVQAYYRHDWLNERVTLTVGQYDPTGFFDTNMYANSERMQFIAPLFGTNPALEFGGTANFYGFGGVLKLRPAERIDVLLGVMEGDGDYREMFTRPWAIAETNVRLSPFGREGTYRLFVWENHRHHDPAFSLNPDLRNRGVGLNFDQEVSKHVGIWGRYGVQDGQVAFFDRAASVGVQLGGGLINRPLDAWGFGYGLTMIGDPYRAHRSSLGAPQFDANEGYLETYYRYVLSGVGESLSVAISPDFQYVTNAGGDDSIDPIAVYGIRMQAFF